VQLVVLISTDPSPVIPVAVEKSVLPVTAHSEDGRTVTEAFPTAGFPVADNQQRMREILFGQLSKTSGHYSFTVKEPSFRGLDPSFHGLDPSFHGLSVESERLPLLKAAFLNDIRRRMAELLDAQPCGRLPLYQISPLPSVGRNDSAVIPSDPSPVISSAVEKSVTYKENIANALSRAACERLGAASVEPAYELSHKADAELMRSRYCIRYELGLCPRHQGARDTGPLFLLNNGRRLALHFHCATCEMTVDEA
jgi:putative protease